MAFYFLQENIVKFGIVGENASPKNGVSTKFFNFRACLHCAYAKLQHVLRTYVEDVYILQNGAYYERNGLTAYSVGGHDMVLNWMTEITDLLQFYVVSVKFWSDYASLESIVFLIIQT